MIFTSECMRYIYNVFRIDVAELAWDHTQHGKNIFSNLNALNRSNSMLWVKDLRLTKDTENFTLFDIFQNLTGYAIKVWCVKMRGWCGGPLRFLRCDSGLHCRLTYQSVPSKMSWHAPQGTLYLMRFGSKVRINCFSL